MKRLILLPLFLLVLGMFLATKNNANNVPKETYVSQVVIDAPWGKEPRQFGVYFPPEGGPGVGPFAFTLSPKGEIYIFDPENSRIQKFDSGGRFLLAIPLSKGGTDICVNNSGNIYLYDGSLVPKRIYQYDSEGNFIKEYPIVWKDGSMGWWGPIYCDKSGRLFLSYRSDSLKVPMIFQVGTTEMVFSPVQQKATLREGFVGSNNVVLNQGKIFQTKEGELHLVEFNPAKGEADSSRSVKKFNLYRLNLYPSGAAGFTGVDEQLNVYTFTTRGGYVIRKYNPAGDLVAEFTIQKEDYIWTSRSLYLDEHGNVYVMSTSKDGLKIIKWSPVIAGK